MARSWHRYALLQTRYGGRDDGTYHRALAPHVGWLACGVLRHLSSLMAGDVLVLFVSPRRVRLHSAQDSELPSRRLSATIMNRPGARKACSSASVCFGYRTMFRSSGKARQFTVAQTRPTAVEIMNRSQYTVAKRPEN